MARHVFFSFHYERDIWRASQVRNSWVTKDDREAAGFWDSASWESVKRRGEEAVHNWINSQLEGTTVTAVLIGTETNDRPYVDYEIQQSSARGNGIVGVYIHQMKDIEKKTEAKGVNPLDLWEKTVKGVKVKFSKLYKTYDWVDDSGYLNFGDWVEAAAKAAGH